MSTPSASVPRRGEVYWLDFAPATGQEMTGPHPCVIVQNDVGNQHSALTIVVAVTLVEKPSRVSKYLLA